MAFSEVPLIHNFPLSSLLLCFYLIKKAELFLSKILQLVRYYFLGLPTSAGGELSALCLGAPVGQFVALEAPSDPGSVLERRFC